jgi:hypothetical protein
MSRESKEDYLPGRGSYSQRLWDVGLHLDAHGFNALTIIEVRDGLLVRASRAGSRTPELIELANGDCLSGRLEAAHQHPVPRRLFPQGYAPFLEALGARLDVCQAAAISVVEANDFVVVGGIQLVQDGPDGRAYEPLELLLLPSDIQALLASPPVRQPERAEASARTVRDDQSALEAPQTAARSSGIGDVVHRLAGSLRSPVLRLRD